MVGTELVAFMDVQSSLQKRAENRRLDIGPIGLGGFDQQREHRLVDRQGSMFGEQPAVEPQHVFAKNRRESAGIHRLPQGFDHGLEVGRIVAQGFFERFKDCENVFAIFERGESDAQPADGR